MKLYTEEQVRKAIELSRDTHPEGRDYLQREVYDYSDDEVIDLLTPIELPSDQEIEVHVEDDFINAIEIHKYSEEAQLLMKAMCKAGALWMRDKIQGGNNEQQ